MSKSVEKRINEIMEKDLNFISDLDKEWVKDNKRVFTLFKNILEICLTEEGFKKNGSNWRRKVDQLEVFSISSNGEIGFKDMKEPIYNKLNLPSYCNNREKLEFSSFPKNINNGFAFRNYFITKYNLINQKDIGYVSFAKFLCYVEERSITIPYLFLLEDDIIELIIGVEIPGKIHSEQNKSAILKNRKFKIPLSIFKSLVKEIILRKKAISILIKNREILPINKVTSNRNIWYASENSLHNIILKEDEFELFKFAKKIINQFKKSKDLDWYSLKLIFEEAERVYSKYEKEDTSVPSAPDTSKFIAIKAGYVKFDQKFSVYEGYCQFQRYFHMGLKVGSNYRYGSPLNLIKYLLLNIKKDFNLPIYSDGSYPVIRSTGGTSWSAVGLG